MTQNDALNTVHVATTELPQLQQTVAECKICLDR